ncbi:hypothetical protein Taro_037723 [Colocasia esculenta]|uniref:Uncharacterized protein n=1 Tax=Colocasia esculenta TaxID=4460 RepID=A0A843WBU8_COLES|nr:hypothetical protein [Colocasia esculenta]
MKRKKWTEEEEAALIREYSELAGSGELARLKTRERKFQPIADRVNSLHHLCDPAAFPFRWAWRDVSIKIQNMRHQYLGVKQKIRLPPPPPSSCSSSSAPAAGCCFDWASGEHHWPNFLRYKQVFGDIDLDSVPSAAAAYRTSSEAGGEEEEEEEDEQEEGDGYDEGAMDGIVNGEDEATAGGGRKTGVGETGVVSSMGRRREGKLGLAAARSVVEMEQALLTREERRRERERKEEVEREVRAQHRREREHQRDVEEVAAMHEKQWRWAEEERDWWRRREELWEEEEMEWRARVLGMQMEHEKQVMQIHADACQAQTQMLGILVRLVCQFIGSGGGGDAGLGGLSHQVLHNLQQQQQHQQQEQGSMGADNGKSDASSAGHYMDAGGSELLEIPASGSSLSLLDDLPASSSQEGSLRSATEAPGKGGCEAPPPPSSPSSPPVFFLLCSSPSGQSLALPQIRRSVSCQTSVAAGLRRPHHSGHRGTGLAIPATTRPRPCWLTFLAVNARGTRHLAVPPLSVKETRCGPSIALALAADAPSSRNHPSLLLSVSAKQRLCPAHPCTSAARPPGQSFALL